jgi:manganese efflux pump family protein
MLRVEVVVADISDTGHNKSNQALRNVMSTRLGTIALLLGIDSVIAGTALGTARPVKRRLWSLALAFAICDGMAFMLGSWVFPFRAAEAFGWFERVGIAVVTGYAGLILALALRSQRDKESASANPWYGGRFAFVVPLALSLDNFVAGTGYTGEVLSSAASAISIGVVSGGLALVGLSIGLASSRIVPVRREWLAGGILVLLAVLSMSREMIF